MVLLDTNISTDEIEIIGRIKNKCPNLIVIVQTEQPMRDEIGIEYDINDYISKPIDSKLLIYKRLCLYLYILNF